MKWSLELEALIEWLRRSEAEAERLLPRLLQLDAADLDRELARHPEWQPGITQILIRDIQGALHHDPSRAHDLTAVLVEHAGLNLPLRHATLAVVQKCRAWTLHARALSALGRYAEAHEAIATASELCRHLQTAIEWLTALAQIVEAEILHGLGKSADALPLIPPAAAMFVRRGDGERYAAATMLDAQIRRDTGDPAAAEEVWRAARGEWPPLDRRLPYVDWCMGRYELRNGDAGKAERSFHLARELFHLFELPRESVRARWDRARALAALGQFDKAARHYRRVQAEMLAANDLVDAAIASTELLDAFVVASDTRPLLPLAQSLVRKFGKAGLPLNAMHAWIFVRERARARALTREDAAAVRAYFHRLPLRPNAMWDR